MAKVEVNPGLQGQRVRAEDGSRVKIDRVLSNKYVLSDGSKVLPHQLIMKGKSLIVDTELTKRDVEDSGDGYAVLKDDKKSAPASTKSSDKKSGKKDEKPAKSSRANKHDDEEEEEKPAKRGRKVVDEDELEQPAVEVTTIDTTVANAVRDITKSALFNALSGSFSNFNPSKSTVGVQFNPEQPNLTIAIGAVFNIAAPEADEFEFTSKTLRQVKDGLWQQLVAKKHPAVSKIVDALEVDSLDIGNYLVDLESQAFVFAGVALVDGKYLNFVMQSLSGETVVLENITHNLGELEPFDVSDTVSTSELEDSEVDDDEFAGFNADAEDEDEEEEESDDEEESEEASEDEEQDVLAGIDQEEFDEYLADMDVEDINDHIGKFFDIDKKTQRAINEMDEEELKEFFTSLYYSDEEEEESEEESDDDSALTLDDLAELNSQELADYAEENEVELPEEFFLNGKPRKSKRDEIANFIVEWFSPSEEEESEEEEEEESSYDEETINEMKFAELVELAENENVSIPKIAVKMKNVKKIRAVLIEALVNSTSEFEEDAEFDSM